MTRRPHADEIVKWASDIDSVVWRLFIPAQNGEPRWAPAASSPGWLSDVEYKTILPEYDEAWQVWLDGELQIKLHGRMDSMSSRKPSGIRQSARILSTKT